jgi:hypothetical protein
MQVLFEMHDFSNKKLNAQGFSLYETTSFYSIFFY